MSLRGSTDSLSINTKKIHKTALIKPEVADTPVMKKATKPKGMQFDEAYKTFNKKFVIACTILSDCSQQWVKYLSEKSAELREEDISEIESSIGQAKLLLESKLPQFADLLYSYLSRTSNPHPVLECDLDGWWAVAAISVEAVKDRFEKLEKLSSNNWKAQMAAGERASKEPARV